MDSDSVARADTVRLPMRRTSGIELAANQRADEMKRKQKLIRMILRNDVGMAGV